jgi:hypothetical protein
MISFSAARPQEDQMNFRSSGAGAITQKTVIVVS